MMGMSLLTQKRECIVPDVNRALHGGIVGLHSKASWFTERHYSRRTINQDPNVELMPVERWEPSTKTLCGFNASWKERTEHKDHDVDRMPVERWEPSTKTMMWSCLNLMPVERWERSTETLMWIERQFKAELRTQIPWYGSNANDENHQPKPLCVSNASGKVRTQRGLWCRSYTSGDNNQSRTCCGSNATHGESHQSYKTMMQILYLSKSGIIYLIWNLTRSEIMIFVEALNIFVFIESFLV